MNTEIYLCINNKINNKKQIKINVNKNIIKILLNINNSSHDNINGNINKIKNLLNIYSDIKLYLKFDNLNVNDSNHLIAKINNIIYKNKSINTLKLFNVCDETVTLMNELISYKNIVIDPNKNPETYLNYILNKIPDNYDSLVFEINNNNFKMLFPLTHAVGLGSNYKAYFVHILPKHHDENKKNVYLIGKSITYDSGGLNIKTSFMEFMKTDMAGSALLLSLSHLLNCSNNYNYNFLFPIVENMISKTAIRPGMVVTSFNNKTVEINNTDAEGRLCIADCINYINSLININNIDKKSCLILDIATLTGNVVAITDKISAVCMCNMIGKQYINNLIESGEMTGEYVDYLQLREEYLKGLDSNVADIKNSSDSLKCGCIIGGTFINYFCDSEIPWIHIDIAGKVLVNDNITSYGLNLLFHFFSNLTF